MSASPLTDQNRHELFERGYTVVKQFWSAELCAKTRALMDRFIGGPDPIESITGGRRTVSELENYSDSYEDEYIESCLADRTPVLTSANWRHALRHPICDPLTAEMVTAGGGLRRAQCCHSRLSSTVISSDSPAWMIVIEHTAWAVGCLEL